MAEPVTRRSLRLHVICVAALIALFAGGTALAIEAGDYKCEIDSAIGITMAGDKIELEEAPSTFRLQAVDAPVTAEELRRPSRSLDHYQPEELPIVSASIDVRLFHYPTRALRSRGGLVYTQGANVIVFSDDNMFMAYGLANKKILSGAAIYSGKCMRL